MSGHNNHYDRIARAARLAAPIYAENGWEWQHDGRGRFVPDAADIALCISRLYENIESGSKHTATGRLGIEVDEADGSVSVYVELAALREAVE